MLELKIERLQKLKQNRVWLNQQQAQPHHVSHHDDYDDNNDDNYDDNYDDN